MTTITWLTRYGHVLSAALWVGSYALLALVIVPVMERTAQTERGASTVLGALAVTAVRIGTYAGTLTIGFGLVLITRTRGFTSLFAGEWGGIVLVCFLLAIALLGVGDGALRPALNRLATGGEGGNARRLAYIGLGITALAIGLMTRAIYARS